MAFYTMEEYIRKNKKNDDIAPVRQTTPAMKPTAEQKAIERLGKLDENTRNMLLSYEEMYNTKGAYAAENELLSATGWDMATLNSYIKDVNTVTGEGTYLQKGAFEDGVTWENALKAGNATRTDILEDAAKGTLNFGEKIIDGATMVLTSEASEFVVRFLLGRYTPFSEDGIDKFYDNARNWAADFVAQNFIDEEAITKKYIVDPFEEKYGYSMEEASVLGAKSDALVQSLPEVVIKQGIALAGNAVAPGLGTVASNVLTGLSSMGGEAENAFRNNATYGQAFLSGAVSAAAEMGTEALFGGIKFGGKTLMDGAVKNIVSEVPGKVLKTLTKWGINTAGEGAEEVLSGFFSALGQKATYLSDKEFNEIFSKEDAWDNFVAGAVLGGIFEGGKVVGSSLPFAKTDYITGNLKTEQKVIDSIASEMIAEQEQSGKKLTESEKSKIYDSIEKSMDKGEIDIATIEKVLGKNAQDAVKNTRLAESYKNASSQKTQAVDAGSQSTLNQGTASTDNQNVKGSNSTGHDLSQHGGTEQGTTAEVNTGIFVDGKRQNTNAIEAESKNIESQKHELHGNNAAPAEANLNKLLEMGNDSTKNVANQGEPGKIESTEDVESSGQFDVKSDDTSSVPGEGGSGSGIVEFKAPPDATPAQIAQVKAYVDGCNEALKAGKLSSTGRVSTQGSLRRRASRAARKEAQRAMKAGTPYTGHVGHVPDTTWTGTPDPYDWLDLDPVVNTSLGGQSNGYPIGYKPTGFVFKEDN